MCPMIKPTIKPNDQADDQAKDQFASKLQAIGSLWSNAEPTCEKGRRHGFHRLAQKKRRRENSRRPTMESNCEDLGLASNPVLSESKELTKTWQVLASQSRNLRGIRV